MLPDQFIDRRYLLRKYNRSKLILVSDLHLGFDIGLSRRFDTQEPRWSYDIIDNLKVDIENTKANYLLVLGDLEHTFFNQKSSGKVIKDKIELIKESKEKIFAYFEEKILSRDELEFILLNGEHDTTVLDYFGSSIASCSNEGIIFNDYQLGVFHGNQKPKDSILLSSEIILGHVHPTIEFVDELKISHKIPVFAKLTQTREELFRLFEFKVDLDDFLDFSLIDFVSLIILPSYNNFLPGFLLNKPKGIQAKTKVFPELKTIIKNPKLNIRMTDGVEIGFLEDL